MASVSEALAVASTRLDLTGALDRIAKSDLLPPRPEDKAIGQLRSGWLKELESRIVAGSYIPVPAIAVYVPKPRFSTRPAALLPLGDRVPYEALSSRRREGAGSRREEGRRCGGPGARPRGGGRPCAGCPTGERKADGWAAVKCWGGHGVPGS